MENEAWNMNKPSRRGKWSSEEDDGLRRAVEYYGEKHWRLVSHQVPGRSPIQCLHRWSKILKPGLVKGPWTISEDEKLKEWVALNGSDKWAACSGEIPGRSSKQCRERWYNILNPNVKKGNWTPDEDKIIFNLYHEIGTQWTKMAQELPGRTENSIKNRFYSNLRKYTKLDTPKKSEPVASEKIQPADPAEDRMFNLLQQVNELEVMLQNTRKELMQIESEFDFS